MKKIIEVDLTLAIKENSLLAHLVFSNITSNELLLDKFLICYNNIIRNNLFKVFDDKNREVDYLGPYVKRFISEEDYISVHPGEKVETSVVSNEVYEVKKGKRYKIQYSAYHPVDIEGSEITKVKSNLAEIVY
jgi:hypothetical protein